MIAVDTAVDRTRPHPSSTGLRNYRRGDWESISPYPLNVGDGTGSLVLPTSTLTNRVDDPAHVSEIPNKKGFVEETLF